MRVDPLKPAKKLKTPADLSWTSLEEAIHILGKDEDAFWTITVPSQLLTTAHDLANCFGMYVGLSTWMHPDSWSVTKNTQKSEMRSNGVRFYESVKESVISDGA